MNDDGNAAIFVGTNFDTGQSITVCPPCLVSFCATIVEGMTGVPVAALIDAAQSGELELVADGDLTTDEVMEIESVMTDRANADEIDDESGSAIVND